MLQAVLMVVAAATIAALVTVVAPVALEAKVHELRAQW